MRARFADAFMRKLAAGGAAALVIKVGAAGAGYAMLVVVARLMPAAEFGRFGFALALAVTLSQVAALGLPIAVLRFWPQHLAAGEEGAARSFAALGFAAVVAGAVVVWGLLVVVGGALGLGAPPYLALAGALVAAMALAEYVQAALRADGSVVAALAPRDIGWRLCVIALAWAVAGTGGLDAEGALAVTAAALALVVAPQLVYAARRLSVGARDLAPGTHTRFWAVETLPMWASTVLFGLVQQVDVIVLGLFLAPEQTGGYYAAARTAALMALLPIAVGMVAPPVVARLYHERRFDDLDRMFRALVVAVAVPTFAAFVVLVVAGRWLLGLFDASFVAAYPMLLVIAGGTAVAALGGPVAHTLQMVGRGGDYLKSMATTYAVVVVAQVVLVPLAGPMAAAATMAAGAVVAAFWGVVLLRRHAGIDPSALLFIAPVARSGRASGAGALVG